VWELPSAIHYHREQNVAKILHDVSLAIKIKIRHSFVTLLKWYEGIANLKSISPRDLRICNNIYLNHSQKMLWILRIEKTELLLNFYTTNVCVICKFFDHIVNSWVNFKIKFYSWNFLSDIENKEFLVITFKQIFLIWCSHIVEISYYYNKL